MTKLAVFASGTGSNFDAIARACADGVLDAEVSVLVCDNPKAAVIGKAEGYGIETFVFSPKSYGCKAEYEKKIVEILDAKGVELVCLAGYMRIVSDVLLNAYEGKIINIHPSLLPSFRGAHAVEDAMAYGVKVYGVTIHYVNAVLDGGKIIAQKAYDYEGSDIDECHRLGHEVEHELYVNTIKKLIGQI